MSREMYKKWIRDLKNYREGGFPQNENDVGGSEREEEGYPPKSESWLNLEMTSHVARLAQILLAPSQHSNYFALTAILTATTTTAAAATIEVWPSKGKTTCVANTDVSRKDQQMLEFRLAKKLLKIKMHIIHLPVWILSRNALDTKSRPKKCAIIHYVL